MLHRAVAGMEWHWGWEKALARPITWERAGCRCSQRLELNLRGSFVHACIQKAASVAEGRASWPCCPSLVEGLSFLDLLFLG